jgi:ribosome-associated translation inhibitor RaiA
MDIRVKTSDFQMTSEVSDHLDDKLAHIEKTLGGESEQTRMEIELGRATGHHKHSEYLYVAELQLIRPGTQRLVARNHEPTIDAAIDNAQGELMRQLRQEKRLHARVWRRGGALAKRLLRLE